MRRIGILMPFPPKNTEMQVRLRAFRDELRKRGWATGVNIQFDERWTGDNMDLIRSAATNLVGVKSRRNRGCRWPGHSHSYRTDALDTNCHSYRRRPRLAGLRKNSRSSRAQRDRFCHNGALGYQQTLQTLKDIAPPLVGMNIDY